MFSYRRGTPEGPYEPRAYRGVKHDPLDTQGIHSAPRSECTSIKARPTVHVPASALPLAIQDRKLKERSRFASVDLNRSRFPAVRFLEQRTSTVPFSEHLRCVRTASEQAQRRVSLLASKPCNKGPCPKFKSIESNTSCRGTSLIRKRATT